DRRPAEAARPGCPGQGNRDGLLPKRRVEDSHHAGTSLVTKGTERPRLHEGKKAECPPASPPPTVRRMSSGPRPRWTRTPSSRAETPEARHRVGETGEKLLRIRRAVAQDVVAGLRGEDGDGRLPRREAA